MKHTKLCPNKVETPEKSRNFFKIPPGVYGTKNQHKRTQTNPTKHTQTNTKQNRIRCKHQGRHSTPPSKVHLTNNLGVPYRVI